MLIDLKEDVLDEKDNLHRMGMFSALAIAIHNFPEGLATFASALSDPALGLSIAVAISLQIYLRETLLQYPYIMQQEAGKRPFSTHFYPAFQNLWEH